MASKLRPKYVVCRLDAQGQVTVDTRQMPSTDPSDVDSPFVLMPRKDPAAFVAMIAYARHCETDLASEIKAWLRKIVEAEPIILGTQGERNFRATRLKALQDIF